MGEATGKILITGNRGYVGQHVWRLCGEAGHDLRGLDLQDGEDVTDRGDTGMAMVGGPPDAVVHLAAWCRVGESMKRPRLYAHHNVTALLSLMGALEAARFAGRFVFASTLLARWPDSSPYAASKAYGEQLLAAQAKASGFSAVILRLGNVAGGGDRTPGRLMVEAADAIREGRSLELSRRSPAAGGDGTCVRDYVHVADVARAFFLAIMAPVGSCECLTVDVGRGEGVSSFRAAEAVSRAAGMPLLWRQAAARPGDVPEVVADTAAVRSLLGWAAVRSLDDVAADAWREGGR